MAAIWVGRAVIVETIEQGLVHLRERTSGSMTGAYPPINVASYMKLYGTRSRAILRETTVLGFRAISGLVTIGLRMLDLMRHTHWQWERSICTRGQ